MMKKTLMALALATTAVSGSAIAWSESGAGGVVKIGGELNTPANVNPWEVLVGDSATDLDMPIALNTKTASLTTTKPIPVLGIRTISKDVFQGAPGLDPKIVYGGGATFTNWNKGLGTLTLPMKDAGQAVIGMLTAPVFGGVVMSRAGNPGIMLPDPEEYSLSTSSGSGVFVGGLPGMDYNGGVNSVPGVISGLTAINPDYVANFNSQNANKAAIYSGVTATDELYYYSGFYGAGIPTGSNITANFTNNVTGSTTWTASLPISVTYQ